MLGEFLRENATRRREPGVWDCCAFPADWALAAGWADPMAAWRGAYDTEEGARVLIDRAGGLDKLFAQGMADAGIPEVVEGEPQVGDIGVVEALGEQAGAVYTGRRWAFVADRGIGAASLEPAAVVRFWRVGNG